MAHSDLDERAIEALKEFNEEGALQVLVQFKESDLSHVQVSALALLFESVVKHGEDLLTRLACFHPEQKCLSLWRDEDLQAERETGDQSCRCHERTR